MSDPTPRKSERVKYRRNLETRWTVRWAENVSRWMIALGGVGTVICVFGVSLFLAVVVLPLFLPGDSEPLPERRGEWLPEELPLAFSVDEYRNQGWLLERDGEFRVFKIDDGTLIQRIRVAEPGQLTATSFSVNRRDAALGYRDGTVRLARLNFEVQFIPDARVPEGFEDMEPGDTRLDGQSLIQRTDGGQFRRQTFRVELEDSLKVSDSPVRALEHLIHAERTLLASLDDGGALSLRNVKRFENMFSGEVELEVEEAEIPYETPELADGVDPLPVELYVSPLADRLMAIWEDGNCLRFDTSDFEAPLLAESIRMLDDPTTRVSIVDTLLGRGTILVGDTTGQVGAWVVTKPEGAKTPDGVVMHRAHVLDVGEKPVITLGPSARNRLVIAGEEDGRLHLFNVTNRNEILQVEVPGEPRPALAMLAPKNDAILAINSRGLFRWELDPLHPEATLASLFLPVWYEGYDDPAHVWQSTGGEDSFEPKLGLWPLVFGTLKATFYTLLFGVPIALLAAIYTSEYLTQSWKARIKTVVELMASLPSVVLGFLGALVLAPIVQGSLPVFLALIVTIPVAFVLGGYAWQLLPEPVALRFSPLRLVFMILVFPIGVALAFIVGPVLESLLFAGNARLWLDGQIGGSFGGWLVLMLPLSGLIVGIFFTRVVGPRFRQMALDWDARKASICDLLRLGAACLITLAIAALAAGTLTVAGVDVRGDTSVFDTYVQRNALIVGFVMGFAVIPIIYTIAEDALAAVPSHLRAASYGAGATPWQTAVRIVVPTAMSGLFSAVMIGLGRAVGETMIVLMAAGNTAILEMNIFNGFRTLSANIAVELPEAVRDSTHYRTLFLAAFILFLMTFVINTVAEAVRLHFRKRSMQL